MPRPSRAAAPARNRVVVRVTVDELRDLTQVARENGTTLAGVIRDAVNEYVTDYREAGVFRLPNRDAS